MRQNQSPVTISQYIGRRVRTLRQAQRISQEKLAERAELSESIVRQIERESANPTLDTLHRIASCLRTEISDLLPAQREIAELPGDLTEIDAQLQDMPASTRALCLRMFYSLWGLLQEVLYQDHREEAGGNENDEPSAD